jgi:spartin
VRPAPNDLLEDLHPYYKNSAIVSHAAAASRLIITASDMVSAKLQAGADAFASKVKPNPTPMAFSPATQARVRQVHDFTAGAAGLSAKAVQQVSKVAQNMGARIARKSHRVDGGSGVDENGHPIDGFKPGYLNKTMMAFSTVADGIETAGKGLMTSTGNVASSMVEHKFGPEAGALAHGLTAGVKNVGLVYIDATGVSRKAIIKSVAKGMVVGKFKDGTSLVVGSTGDLVAAEKKESEASSSAGPSQPTVNINDGHWPPPPTYEQGEDNSLYERPEKSAKDFYH